MGPAHRSGQYAHRTIERSISGTQAKAPRVAKSLDVLVALGTHPPMPERQIRRMLGITDDDPGDDLGLFNHEWDNPDALVTIGTLSEQKTREISGGLLAQEVPVRINRRIPDCDVALIAGPVFPHEVAGFSGGNKYFFPGISGPELLHFFHSLGALITNVGIVGIQENPMRSTRRPRRPHNPDRTTVSGFCSRRGRVTVRPVLRHTGRRMATGSRPFC